MLRILSKNYTKYSLNILRIPKKDYNQISNRICYGNFKPILQPSTFNVNSGTLQLLKNKNISLMDIVKRFGCSHSNYADKEWNVEKIVTVLLLFLIPVAILIPSKWIDYAIAAFIVQHHYVGIQSVLVDYARPVVLGKGLAKTFFIGHALCTILIAYGLFKFIRNDIGLGEGIRRIWRVNQGPDYKLVKDKPEEQLPSSSDSE